MKVLIPLDSSLCTDSHPNEIKDPQVSRDLFSHNRTYLFNKSLTNPRKTTIPKGYYITTEGDTLEVIPGSEKTRIAHKGQFIADVLSLGIEKTDYLDKDDAVIDSGSLWSVVKTLTGYVLEQTDLQTGEVLTTPVNQEGVTDVRFVKNTHKVITRNSDGTVTIDGTVHGTEEMQKYLVNTTGELIAVEINGKTYFGLQNPKGVGSEAPSNVLDLSITENINGWTLWDKLPDQNFGYQINITISNNVHIGAGATGYALDLLTGITNPQLHTISINLEYGVVISGKGGDGGSVFDYSNISAGKNGGAAINTGSTIIITGYGTIQGGGGGGAAYAMRNFSLIIIGPTTWSMAGGGGAGNPPGGGGQSSYGDEKYPGKPGTETTGGNAGGDSPGKGGNPGQTGGGVPSASGRNVGSPGTGGAAIRVVSPAAYSVDGPQIIGGIVTV
jgi:hypothetical protein